MRKILDHGYVQLVETWGSDERIIEAARMSVDKGFISWDAYPGAPKGDAGLLAHLYNNKHSTPFEMAGLVIEVKAPIFVFREWHRHRTQSYNEMSARYIPLPDENYMPSLDRLLDGANTPTANKQAQGKVGLTIANAAVWMDRLDRLYDDAQQLYADGIEVGIPKELARLPVPVARYSRMRASANLRNWLGFLALRGHPTAQWEIQQYAQAVAELVHEHFPRTMNLFTAEQARNQS
jgi:thymidylate synthase (FAD)